MQLHDDLLKRPLLARGVEMDGHRGAAAERHQKQLVGTRTGVAAAGRDRLVGLQGMTSVQHDLVERTGAGRRHDDGARRNGSLKRARIAPGCRAVHVDLPAYGQAKGCG